MTKNTQSSPVYQEPVDCSDLKLVLRPVHHPKYLILTVQTVGFRAQYNSSL